MQIIKFIIITLLILPNISNALNVMNIFLNSNQKASQLYSQKNYEGASEMFNNQEWKGVSLYKNKSYKEAYDIFNKEKNAVGYYNKGNALAYMGEYENAIQAYRKALEINKNYPDAEHNISILESLINKKNKDQQNKDQQNKDQQNKSQKKILKEANENSRDNIDSIRKKRIQNILNQIPDDPGGLLKQKFLRDYQRQLEGTKYND